MKTEESTKFDYVKFMRETRRKIHEEIKNMSVRELDEYWRKFRQTNPVWQRWVARQNAVKQQTSDT